jgi:type VI secretion system protein ImpF
MARILPEQELTPSVLDRLIDLEPRNRVEAAAQRSARLADLKRAVRRDLEWLLNTRRSIVSIPEGMDQLDRSLLTYGLPDLSSLGVTSPEAQETLRRSVLETIDRFEPRLMQVEVTLLASDEKTRSLHFRIDGLLRVYPEPEPVRFDSQLQLPTSAFHIEGD